MQSTDRPTDWIKNGSLKSKEKPQQSFAEFLQTIYGKSLDSFQKKALRRIYTQCRKKRSKVLSLFLSTSPSDDRRSEKQEKKASEGEAGERRLRLRPPFSENSTSIYRNPVWQSKGGKTTFRLRGTLWEKIHKFLFLFAAWKWAKIDRSIVVSFPQLNV